MGDIADSHVENFVSGRWGVRIKPKVDFAALPKTTRAAIRYQRFSIVEVVGVKTNRSLGTKLIVCSRDENYYWVWASQKVTGIAKDQCKVLQENLGINEALGLFGRKPWLDEDI